MPAKFVYLFVLLAATASAASQSADSPAGHYYLRGVREVGSELLLRPDGKFEYMLAYGAADYMASGTWKRDGDSVVLNTEGKDEPPFKLLRSSAAKSSGIRVILKRPGGQPVPNIDVMLKTDTGFLNARTDSDGVAMFESSQPAKSVMFEIRVYNFRSKPVDLNPAHNEFQFQINGEAITTVQFKDERLKIDGKVLEMRFWNKDEVMKYAKQYPPTSSTPLHLDSTAESHEPVLAVLPNAGYSLERFRPPFFVMPSFSLIPLHRIDQVFAR